MLTRRNTMLSFEYFKLLRELYNIVDSISTIQVKPES